MRLSAQFRRQRRPTEIRVPSLPTEHPTLTGLRQNKAATNLLSAKKAA